MTNIVRRILLLGLFLAGCGGAFAVDPQSSDAADSTGRIGLPIDWSFRHVLYSNAVDESFADAAREEPRVLYNWLLRHPRAPRVTKSTLSPNLLSPGGIGVNVPHRHVNNAQVDWNFTLGAGKVRQNMFPAKYSFDAGGGTLTLANCTNDYVTFALDVAGSSAQPNLIRFNNIYSGTGGLCGSAPTVLSAYQVNTRDAGGTNPLNGKLLTSPSMSLLGTKLAFIETVQGATRICPGLVTASTCSIFHVITWGTTGTNGSFSSGTNTYTAARPGTGNNAVITNLVYSASTNTNSSPYIDYTHDKAYFGDDNGQLYRTTCVFACASGFSPQIETGWPITVTANIKLSPPVFLTPFNKVFVGGSNGNLYVVDLTKCPGILCSIAGGGIAVTTVGSTNTFGGVVDGPIVDGTFGTVFAFAGDDGTGSGVLLETNTSLNLAPNIKLAMGTTSFFDIFDGAFDDAYYQNSAGGTTVTGNVFVCGALGGSGQPELYWMPFTKNTGALSTSNPPRMNTAASSRKNVPGNPGVGCGPLTEFKNGTTDRLFFSQSALSTNKCPQGSGSAADGCVMMYDITTPSTTIGNTPAAMLIQNLGTSGIVIDNASTSPQAASIYFTNLGTAKCTTGTGGGTTPAYCAIKVTQSGLQ